MHPRRTSPRRGLHAAAVALTVPLALLTSALVATPAAAHGSVTDPPTRNYGCWERWGADFQNREMATLDPMCWQAWQDDPSAMWNWNGLYHEGIGGRHEELIPDGQLCSGGRTEGGRYDSLDTPGPWTMATVPQRFTLTLTDQAKHGADYLRVYVTRPGFDPTTTAPAWSDMQLLKVTGSYPTTGLYQTDVDLTGRSGRAILYTIWQASHSDQPYYLCSDINIGGTAPSPTATPTPAPTPSPTSTPSPTPSPTPTPGPTPTPTVSPTPAPTPSPTPTPTPGPTTTPAPGACSATVTAVSTWNGGWQGEVVVTAGAGGLSGWAVTLGGATVTQAWNSSASGAVLTSAAWNAGLAPGASTTAGFLASGAPGALTATCAPA